MTTRQINFSEDIELIFRDKFGNDLAKFQKFQKGENELIIPSKDGYYQSKTNKQFFIYEGEGVLEFPSDCLKKYDFEHLNLVFLDYYLINNKHHPNADKFDKKQIKDYLELYEKHENGDFKINPPFFDEIEEKLLNGL